MKAKFALNIPYGERSKYFPLFKKINDLVDRDGVCALFVNNVPHRLLENMP